MVEFRGRQYGVVRQGRRPVGKFNIAVTCDCRIITRSLPVRAFLTSVGRTCILVSPHCCLSCRKSADDEGHAPILRDWRGSVARMPRWPRDGTFPFTSFPRVSGLWRRVYGKEISVVHSAAWSNGIFASPELYSNPTWAQVRSHDAQNQKPFLLLGKRCNALTRLLSRLRCTSK